MPEAVYACGEVVGVSPKRSGVPRKLLMRLGGVGVPWDGPDALLASCSGPCPHASQGWLRTEALGLTKLGGKLLVADTRRLLKLWDTQSLINSCYIWPAMPSFVLVAEI